MHRHGHPQGGVYRFKFFAGETPGDVIHACATVTDRKGQTENAKFTHSPERKGNWLLLAIIFLDHRDDLFLCKVTHHLFCHFMFGGKGEIHDDLCVKIFSTAFSQYSKPGDAILAEKKYCLSNSNAALRNYTRLRVTNPSGGDSVK